ncbi:MAG: hypothetical protein M5T61_05690 [Acidimicrobiia bacterium]|nr:hypothetical protein [Acidimicrobiia bacterium]
MERVLPGSAVAHLVWEVNRAVADHAGDHLLLHAAAAERDGAVVLLPAPRESGKSTLVAGLVRAGMRYLTDEATAVSLTSGGVTGFAKPIGLDPGSWQVLADLEPLTAGAPAPLPSMQWLVPPLALRPDSVATGGRAAIVVLPCYRADAPTVLQPIPRAEALVAMAESSFNFHALGGRALHALAALLRDATCFRLDVSDLDTACNAISEAMPLASREVSG